MSIMTGRTAPLRDPAPASQRRRSLERLAFAIRETSGWRRALIAAAAGALSVLAFAPFHLAPVLFATLPALFWIMDGAGEETGGRGRTRRQAVVRAGIGGWWFGFGFHLVGLHWIGSAFLVEAERFAVFMPFAIAALPAGLAAFSGAASATASLVRGPVVSRVVALAVALAIAEWLRGTILTGFPWNALGYGATWPLVLMQSAGVLGIYGLSLWVALIGMLPLALAAQRTPQWRGRDGVALGLLVVAPMAAGAAYGSAMLAVPMPPDANAAKLRLVQPSVRQRDKFLPEKRLEIFERHINLTTKGGLEGITHVLWPEAAMPFLALRSEEALSRIAAALPDTTTLVAGTLRLEGPLKPAADEVQHVFNSAIALDGRGELVAVYDKLHLVPFGEFLPLKQLFDAIGFEHLTRQRGGFTAGRRPRRLVRVPGLPPLALLICYETVFPGETRSADGRAGLLVNLTNDAWFGRTIGPRQHFQQARVRAVEQGVPMVRVANNGISGVIDARGRVLHQLPLDAVGIVDAVLPMPVSQPIYARYGETAFIASLAMVAALGLLFGLTGTRKPKPDN